MFDETQAIEALKPFEDAARSPQNIRPQPLATGGLKRTARAFIDLYVAFRTEEHNIRICCYVPEPGDAPCFLLRVDNRTAGVYNRATLPAALPVFRKMIEQAQQPGVTVKDLVAPYK
jgi:hypothetical protein